MAFDKTKQKVTDMVTEPMKPIAIIAAAALVIAVMALIVAAAPLGGRNAS